MLTLVAVAGLEAPADPPPLAAVALAGECRLAPPLAGPPCACADLSGTVRRLLGLPIPLDRASASILEALPGIGPVRAQAIVAERARGGPFRRVDDLARVAGIGPATIARLRPYAVAAEPDSDSCAPDRTHLTR